jgi:membrane associated rhomboid family serine protease
VAKVTKEEESGMKNELEVTEITFRVHCLEALAAAIITMAFGVGLFVWGTSLEGLGYQDKFIADVMWGVLFWAAVIGFIVGLVASYVVADEAALNTIPN